MFEGRMFWKNPGDGPYSTEDGKSGWENPPLVKNIPKKSLRVEDSYFDEIIPLFARVFVIAIISIVILLAVLIWMLAKSVTFKEIFIFGIAIFAIAAFWANNHKEKIPEILEFKEPQLPKE